MPPRVVVDTNVIISALHRGGTPRAVLTLARREEIDLRLSPFILAEVRGVLRTKFGWETPRIRLAVRSLHATIVRPGRPHPPSFLIPTTSGSSNARQHVARPIL